MPGLPIPYTLIRSSRKTISLEVRPDGSVLVRAPKRLPDRAVREFVASKESWLRRKLEKTESRAALPKLTVEELSRLKREAREDLTRRAADLAPRVGVSFGRIAIRAQKSRWGSCSAEGNLNFNCLLMLAPEPVRDYVVIHELCHRKQMNHSERFWAQVAAVCPAYQIHRKWLKDNGGSLLARLPD